MPLGQLLSTAAGNGGHGYLHVSVQLHQVQGIQLTRNQASNCSSQIPHELPGQEQHSTKHQAAALHTAHVANPPLQLQDLDNKVVQELDTFDMRCLRKIL